MSSDPPTSWTQEEFFAWAEKQDMRYEFDGLHPVAMAAGTVNAGIVLSNLSAALVNRLRGGKCRPFGPDNGVATIGKAVRYPDQLITCTKQEGTAKIISDVKVIFEIVSPNSARRDRFTKVREYRAVDSIRRYVILESTSIDITVMEREEPKVPWLTTTLTKDDTLSIPEVGIEIPIAEIYEEMTFPEDELSEA